MVVCPNCHHQNIEGVSLCEICYTSLPIKSKCPNCDADVLSNATFCGQCGFVLSETPATIEQESENEPDIFIENNVENPETVSNFSNNEFMNNINSDSTENQITMKVKANSIISEENQNAIPPIYENTDNQLTELQVRLASLLHLQTNQVIELPTHLSVIHLGKENDKIPPDIDLSGFPDSQIVSRIHADIRVEADAFYIEDVGSANGTYINHTPLAKGNLHLLRAGDRIAFGKEDKVTFIFQLSH